CYEVGTLPAPSRVFCPGTVVDMDGARTVLERMERIDELQRGGAGPRELIAELRALVGEAEAWARAEQVGGERLSDARDRCRDALAREPARAGEEEGRTLVA